MVLAFDEPTENLDEFQIGRVLRHIANLGKEFSVVVASHRLSAAQALGAGLIMLRRESDIPQVPSRLAGVSNDVRLGAPNDFFSVLVETPLVVDPWPADWKVDSRLSAKYEHDVIIVSGYKPGNHRPSRLTYTGRLYPAHAVAGAIEATPGTSRDMRAHSLELNALPADAYVVFGPESLLPRVRGFLAALRREVNDYSAGIEYEAVPRDPPYDMFLSG